MPEQFIEASQLGFGTYQYSGTPNTLGGLTLREILVLAGATPDADVSGFDLYFVSAAAPVYFNNDGTDADATMMPFDTPGPGLRARTAKHLLDRLKIYSTGTVDLRIMLWG